MDNIIDLLIPKEKKNAGNIPHLEIKEDVKGNNYISNITTLFVRNKDELDKVIKMAMVNRKVGKTDMNEESSRSHLIITISIEIYDKKTNTVYEYFS
jgi:kinesin family member C1